MLTILYLSCQVYPEDAGSYICEVYNELGDEESSGTLTVKGLLEIILWSSTVHFNRHIKRRIANVTVWHNK